MGTLIWIIWTLSSFTLICQQTSAAPKIVQCNICTDDNARNIGPKHAFLAKGCDDPEVNNKTHACPGSFCYWKINTEEKSVEMMQKDGKKKATKVHPGWLMGKGCDPKGTAASRAGTCKLVKKGHDKFFQCYCNKDNCNKGLPPCKWLLKADPTIKNLTGCAESKGGKKEAEKKVEEPKKEEPEKKPEEPKKEDAETKSEEPKKEDGGEKKEEEPKKDEGEKKEEEPKKDDAEKKPEEPKKEEETPKAVVVNSDEELVDEADADNKADKA